MSTAEHQDEARKVDPGSEAFASWAEQLCAQGLWDEAIQVCRQGLNFYPRHLRGRILLGWALKERAEYGEAEKLLLEAAGEIQQHALTFELLAELAEMAGQVESKLAYRNICQDLQALSLEQTTPAVTESATVAPEPAGHAEAAPLLASLLARFEARPPQAAPTLRLFSEEDRGILAHLIKSRSL